MKDQELQIALLDFLRTGDPKLIPKLLDKDRAKIYNRLTFNNIYGLISGGLPKFSKQFSIKKMQSLVREFIASKTMQTPYFYEMTGEFLQWYSSRRENSMEFRYICQLGHYEWVVGAIEILAVDNRTQWQLQEHMQANYGWREDATIVTYDWSLHKPKSVNKANLTPVNLLLWRIDSPWSVRWREIHNQVALFYNHLKENQGSVMQFVTESFTQQYMPNASKQDKENFVKLHLQELAKLKLLKLD